MNLLQGLIHRATSRPKSYKHNEPRVFGKDITNRNKNQSFQQKPSAKMDIETRSRAHSIKKQTIPIELNHRVELQYETQIITHLLLDDSPGQPILSNEINLKMRAILVDWLVNVQNQFKLKDESYHLCIKLLDEYCGIEGNIIRETFQLVGITCLWIASKTEEIHPPRIKDYVLVTDKACSQEDINQMQLKILEKLCFRVVRTTPLSYLSIALGDAIQSSFGSFCKYIIQLSILEGLTTQYGTTTLVLSAICAAQKTLKRSVDINKFKELVQENAIQTNICMNLMLRYLNRSTWQDVITIRKKYSSSRYHCVGTIKSQSN